MEEPREQQTIEDQKRAQYLEELNSMFDGEKNPQFVAALNMENKIRGGLRPSQDLRDSIDPQHTVLTEQKEPALLEEDLLPPPEVDDFAIGEIGRNLNQYVTGNGERKVKTSSPVFQSNELAKIEMPKKAGISNTEKKFEDLDHAIIALTSNNELGSYKDEIVDSVLKKHGSINDSVAVTKMGVGTTINKLVSEGKLIDDGTGLLRVRKVAGGSINESEKKPDTRWTPSAEFETEFNRILNNVDNPQLKKRLSVFHQFDMQVAKDPETLKNKLIGATRSGVFTNKQRDMLIGVLVNNKNLPEEFVPEPPVIDQQPSFSSYSNRTQNNEATSMMDGIRIGAENWDNQTLEDARGKKMPLTPENYIKSIGGVLSPENIEEVRSALDSLVEQGLGSKTEDGYVIVKKSRITKVEKVTPQAGFFDALKQEVNPERLIHDSESFNELYGVLNKFGGVQGSSRLFTAEELVHTIEGLRGEALFTYPSHITNTYGLRDKVSQLLEKEKVTSHPEETPSVLEVPQTSLEEVIPVTNPSVRVKTLNERMREAKEKISPVEISKESARQMFKYEPEQGPIAKEDLSVEEIKKIEGEMRLRLSAAREKFATEEVHYKNKVKEGKKIFRSIMETLAPGKQRPLPEKEPEHKEAEKEYLEAKYYLTNFISGRDVKEFEVSRDSVLGQDVLYRKVDVGVFEQAEGEYKALQERILSATPQRERSRIEGLFQKWNEQPLAARVVLSAALLTAGGVALGSVGVSGALAAFGWRAGRAFAGATLGLKVGQKYGEKKDEEIVQKRNDYLEEYGANSIADKENFSEGEKDLGDFFKKQKKEIFINKIKKAAVTSAVAGVTTVGLGVGAQAAGEYVSGSKVSSGVDTTPKPKPSLMDKMFKKPSPVESATAPKVVVPEKIVEASVDTKYATPVGVNLSSRGFIDTVDQLKQATNGQKLTPALEKLFAQSPQKIAMDLGLFKPGQAAESASGFQNEKLSIDIDGNLSLEHTGGNEILMNADGTFKPFAGEMFDADKQSTSPVPTDVAPAQKMVEVTPSTPKPVVEVVPKVSNIEIKSSVSQGDAALDIAITSAAIKTGSLVYKDVEIAAPIEDYKTVEDIFAGKLPLKSEHQFSVDPTARNEYSKFFTKILAMMSETQRKELFDYHLPVQYKGGQINIFKKGPDITVLLNGQKIGSTKFIDGKFGFQYEKGVEDFGFSYAGKSQYETAFEEAKKAIVKNTDKFLKTTQK